MSYPILYNSTETAFENNGIGILSGAVSCIVSEERNGVFELEMKYPVKGIHFKEIGMRSLLMAKPDLHRELQPFRVYDTTKPIAGIVTVYARHISYDLSGVPVVPFTANSPAEAMVALEGNAAVDSPFTFWTDKTGSGTMTVSVPCSTRSRLGGVRGSVLDVYGGEYEFDRYTVRLHNRRGADRGVSIRYGKNLMDMTQEENCASVYTGVYPFWSGADGQLVQLPEKIVNAPGTYNFINILTLDMSDRWQEPPTEEQLRSATNSYISANNIGIPKVSLTVSYVQLEQSEEYEHIAMMERVDLCDTVHVEFPDMGVSASAKCVKTVYNVLLDRYDSIVLGEARTNIADTIASQQEKIWQTPTKTAMQQAINHGTKLITGNLGGYLILRDSDGDGKPDELLFMDTDDIATAKLVLRLNKSGIGFSSSGYNGPYKSAWTLDGTFYANFITAGTMAFDRLRGGVLSLGGETNGNGALYIYDTDGQEVGHIDNTGIHFTKGTINLGNGKFVVYDNGDMEAESGTFRGKVQSKNILAGPDDGYIGSSQIGSQAIRNGNMATDSISNRCIQSGSIYNSTLSGGCVSEAKLDSALQDVVANSIYASKVFSGQVTVQELRTSVLYVDGRKAYWAGGVLSG